MFGKLFIHVINNRVKLWASDKLFPLHNLVINPINAPWTLFYFPVANWKKNLRGEKLYRDFVDLKRAFDSVYRDGLWFELIKSEIVGKLLTKRNSFNVEWTKSCVKQLGTLSEFLSSNVGFLQGVVISPILFSLFLNDIQMSLQRNASAEITLEQLLLHFLRSNFYRKV